MLYADRHSVWAVRRGVNTMSEKENRCKYCGVKTGSSQMCTECYEKLQRIRKLKGILNNIVRLEKEKKDE